MLGSTAASQVSIKEVLMQKKHSPTGINTFKRGFADPRKRYDSPASSVSTVAHHKYTHHTSYSKYI